MAFPAVFALIIGLGILGQWGASAVRGQIPELKTEPARIAFHLAAEFTTALGLILAGAGLLFGWGWARDLFLVASGMLVYTSIVSPGYFVQMGQKIWLLIFGLILALNMWTLSVVWH